ncbi:MAG: hypothetical protein ACLFTQ_03605 [Candidatus Aenigmatarchaeota archaeon]
MTVNKEDFGSVEEINEELFDEMLDEHIALKKAYCAKDYEKVLIKGGKFVETVFQILQDLHTGNYSEQPNFESVQESLRNTESDKYPNSVRLAIPRIARNLYMMRSHRGGAHRSELDPRYIDAALSLSISNWIVSELIRLYSDKEPEEVEHLMKQTVTRNLPLVEEFEDGDVVILAEQDSCREECLLILYHFYPERISNEKMKEYVDNHSGVNVTSSLGNAEDNKLVHRNDNGNKLTSKGRNYVEKKYGSQFSVDVEV